MKLPDTERCLKRVLIDNDINYKDVLFAMQEYSRKVRDATLEWAEKNVKLTNGKTGALAYNDGESYEVYIDKESILNGKTHKDLKI